MTGVVPDKRAIARNFSKAARRYDAWAAPQTRFAAGLAGRLPDGFEPAHIVDMGCGTGILSGLLMKQYPKAHLTGLDLADGMIAVCRARWRREPRARFQVADCEAKDIPSFKWNMDLVACSCSAHWFADAETTLARWAKALAPGGILACALLIRGSFCELEAAYREATRRPFPGLRLPDAGIGRRLARSAGLRVMVCETKRLAPSHSSAIEALRYFRGIGAIFQGRPGYAPLSPELTRRLLACYERMADERGDMAVTHTAQYLVAEKPRCQTACL
ncbi:MAG: methyltransferase domain-containing protein [Verrucomicrobiota bacterium]|nr:methyltransferase domain-containing protein [Verrucomicrobiota bacterium]